MRQNKFAVLLSVLIGLLSQLAIPLVQAKETDQDMSLAPVGGQAMVDPFTGSLSTTIPIEVPPGRHGMQPNLALTYWSGGGNGWVGMGWKLEMGAIERQTRFGVNYSGDDYTFRLSGNSGDLVNIGSGEYRSKIESGFSRIRKLTAEDGLTVWEVTDKVGTKYTFGATAASRQADPSNGARIFKWCLDRVEDTNGNYMTLTYASDQGQSFLDQITYTGNSVTGVAPTNTVKFYREGRSDVSDIYVPDFRVRTAYRLKTIDVLANNSRVRTYRMSYLTSISNSVSLLATIQRYGRDATLDGTGAVVSGTTLPAIGVSYDQGTASISNINSSGGQGLADGPRIFTDINGDGRLEYLTIGSNGCHYSTFYNSNGSINHNNTSCGGGAQLTGTQPGPIALVDINGDGRPEFVAYRDPFLSFSVLPPPPAYQITFYNNDGSIASVTSAISAPNGWRRGPWTFSDINGDGRAEFITANSNGCHGITFFNPDGSLATNPSYCGGQGIADGPWTFQDINGDGRAEYITVGSNGCHYMTFYNADGSISRNNTACGGQGLADGPRTFADINGDGRVEYATVGSDGCHYTTFYNADGSIARNNSVCGGQGLSDGPRTFADINGDGRSEYVTIGSNGCHYITFYTHDGNISTNQTFYGGNGLGDGPREVLDINGDGRAEYVTTDSGGNHYRTFYNLKSSLLTTLSNELGGTVSMAYVPSTQYVNIQLPFPVQTVSNLTTIDANSNTTTTNYTYSGGFYHIAERDFRGFNYAKVTGPIGPNGEQAISETWFHQGNDTAVDINIPNVPTGYLNGKPYRTRVSNGAGQFFTQSTTTYAADANGVAPFFTPLQQLDTSICDGTACGKQTRVVYSYDSYGNVTREDQYGDLADVNDDRTVVRTFAPNTTTWLVVQPTGETIYQGIGLSNQMASMSFYYDGVTDCTVASTNQTPTKGNLTRTVRSLSGGVSPEMRMAYDAVGNRTCTRDANGNTSTVTYDASLTFPKIVTNPFQQQVTTQYYGVDGVLMDKGLYGQVKSVTDPNGAIITTEYDAFGRKTKVTNPDGFSTTMAYNALGTVGSQHVLATSQASATASLSSWTYFDGLGRTIKKKSTGPDSKIVVTDTQYNVRGSVLKTSLPYFETGGTPSWRTMIYDPLSRVVQVTNPDGSRGLSCYDDWVAVSIDANNHRKRETRDAAGQVIRVDEYTGTFSTCDLTAGTPYATTTYQYDVLGNLRFVTDAKGNQSEMRYDTLSRKIFMHDPDMGTWTYAYDANGNLIQQTDAKAQTITFLYDALNRRTTKTLPASSGVIQIINTAAGTGTDGASGDGGPATQAAVSTPFDVATGADGSLYLASRSASRIRKVSPTGLITTVAGNGTVGFSGDGGPATQAALGGAFAVAVATEGTFYIGDTNNNRIRKVTPNGIITTVAGTGTAGFGGDTGPASTAQLAGPYGVAVASDGSVYIADTSNHRVRKISASGIITTVAGTGVAACGGSGSQATATSLYGPTGVTIAPDGRLYIADRQCNRIRRLEVNGSLTTIAGSGAYDFSGDGGPATAAAFRSPFRVAVATDGTVYIADQDNNRIRRVGLDGLMSTVAGTGTAGYSGDGGSATSAQLNLPLGVALGANSTLYIADMVNHRARQITIQATGGSVVAYTYDGTTNNRKGRLQQVQDTSGTATFFYDAMGRIIQSSKTVSGMTYTIQSSYDGLGRVTALTYPDNSVVTNRFNGPLLQAVAEGALNYVQYAGFNALGQPGTATFGNGVVTTYTYANSGNATCVQQTFRLCTLKTQFSTNPVYQDLRYSFDPGGNITTLTDAVNGTQTFLYDELNRLTSATGPYGSGGASATLTYGFDPIGNLTTNSQVGTYAYPTSGLSSVGPHAVSTAGQNSYFYDANGNLTSGAGRTLTYDPENRPLTITSQGTTTTFNYDGDGGRVKKIVGTLTSLYIGKLYECENTACTKLIFAGSQRIAMKQVNNGVVDYYHPDHLGSTSVVTTATGALEQSLAYYPFGGTRVNTGTVNVPYKYTGKELDASTGLYFYEARYYDPMLARFISADTIIPNLRDPQALNRYSYVENNPLQYADPSGHLKIGNFLNRAFDSPVIRGIAWAFAPGLAMYADPATRRPALIGSAAVVGFVIGGPIGSKLAGESAIGLAFWGATGGAVSGGITGAVDGNGNPNSILTGAFRGAAFGAIGGYFGNSWGWERVAANSLAGGISSQLSGRGFIRGFAISLAVSGLSYAAVEMRESMIAQSRLNVGNANGTSDGFMGDGFKLGGGRQIEGLDSLSQTPSPLGGFQGGQGMIFGNPYAPGSFQDHLVEAFAGPHDFLNSGYWYNSATGNAMNLGGISAFFGEALNYANVGFASPFAAASAVPNFGYQYILR